MPERLMYDSLEDFYADRPDPERRRSPESDYGVMWRAGSQTWPLYRVSYIKATGEVYAFRQGLDGPGAVMVLAIVPPDPDTRFEEGGSGIDGPTYYQTLDRILEGWAEVDGHDLAWIVNKLRPYAAAGDEGVIWATTPFLRVQSTGGQHVVPPVAEEALQEALHLLGDDTGD